MADVFISYTGQDRATASALADALEAVGLTVWWDRELVDGDKFGDVITHELDASGCVVILWSHAAAKSPFVAAEGQRAFDAGKVQPVKLDDLNPPLPLSSIQAPALADWDRTAGAPILEELKAAILEHTDSSRLVATVRCPLFRCVAVGEWGVAAASEDGVIRIWSLEDGTEVKEMVGHGDLATAVAWNRDNLLASGGEDRTARLWSVDDGQLIHTLSGHLGGVNDVAFAGEALVSVSEDRTVRWWSLATGEPMQSETLDQGLMSCAADSTGNVVAVGGEQGGVTVFVNRSLDRVFPEAHQGAVWSIDFSPNGERLLTTGADGVARVWGKELLQTYRGHRGPVLSGALNNYLAATGSSDGTVRAWELGSGDHLEQFAGMEAGATGVDVNESLIMATSGRGYVRSAPLPVAGNAVKM